MAIRAADGEGERRCGVEARHGCSAALCLALLSRDPDSLADRTSAPHDHRLDERRRGLESQNRNSNLKASDQSTSSYGEYVSACVCANEDE